MKKASLLVIFLTVFIDLMGFGILIPLLPNFATIELGMNEFEVGITIAIYSLMQFLFNPMLGKLSDKIGRKPIILISLMLTIISYVVFAYSTTFWHLLISRTLAGFGGSNIGVAQAYIADVTPKEQRAKGMGLIGAAFGLGFTLGPFIGGYLAEFGYAMAGWGSAAFSAMAFIFAVFLMPESLKEKKKDEPLQVRIIDFQYVKKVFTMPIVGTLVTIFFIIIFSFANIYGTFPLLGTQIYGFEDKQIGMMFGIMGLAGAIIQGGLIKYISDKFPEKGIILFSMVLIAFGLGLLPYSINFTGIMIVMMVLSIGSSILQPTLMSMVSKYAPESEQGAVLGVNQAFGSLGRVLGPLWGGFSYQFIGYPSPFLTGAIFTVATFFIAVIFLNSQRMKAQKAQPVV